MRISEVARRTGVRVRCVRSYEQQRLLGAQRLENGYRDRDERVVARVQTMQLYLGLGLSTALYRTLARRCPGRLVLPTQGARYA